ncbi:MAG: hypothetical protein KAI47_20220 [Deltaproteobacteria bacterium]|nr:hypothetical protein [Deltaproteobacteria bacterium]
MNAFQKGIVLFVIALGMLLSTRSEARPKVAVIPTGRGEALVPTAGLASALAEQLRAQGKVEPKLIYPLPTALPPKGRSRKAARLMKKAFESFQMLEFVTVRKASKKAMKIFKRKLKAGAAPNTYVEALHLLAAAEHFDGNEDAAFKWMNDAIIWGHRPPASSKFNPAVQALYSKVAGTQNYSGKIDVKATPDALIWLNRRLHGPATGTHEVRAGLYLLRVGRPGFATWHRWLRVSPGQTREISVELKKAPTPEDPRLRALRLEAASVPGIATTTATTDFETDDVLLVTAKEDCTRAHCAARLRWAHGKSWKLKKDIVVKGNQTKEAAKLALTVVERRRQPSLVPTPGDGTAKGERRCMLDSQCYNRERCRGGICKKITPITSKWWFWTLIGAGVAGVATAIAVPLAIPSHPVIEVR